MYYSRQGELEPRTDTNAWIRFVWRPLDDIVRKGIQTRNFFKSLQNDLGEGVPDGQELWNYIPLSPRSYKLKIFSKSLNDSWRRGLDLKFKSFDDVIGGHSLGMGSWKTWNMTKSKRSHNIFRFSSQIQTALRKLSVEQIFLQRWLQFQQRSK